MADPPLHVAALSLTPVKGLRLARAERLEIGRSGARDDRRFYLVDDAGRMVNGKQIGALHEVEAALDGDALELRLPDATVRATVELGDEITTKFFSLTRPARLLTGPFADALSAHAGQRLRIVAPADPASAVDRGPIGAVTVLGRPTLRALAVAAGVDALDGRRFRMSIELEGGDAFAEDAWVGRELAIGAVRLRLQGHVGRCLVTSRDPDTGTIDLPTLDVLRELRAGATTSEPLAFGVYGSVLAGGEVALGDPAALL